MAFDSKKKVDLKQIKKNPYLDSQEQGLNLIASLLTSNPVAKSRHIGNILDEGISACGRIEVSDSVEKFAKMRQIIQLLQMPARNRLLHGCAIIGLGGQFSSGKSSVLNSILDKEATFHLPENTLASTSISTYVMQAKQERVIACSINGSETPLDPDALEAISHKFRDAHKINLAQFIEFIGIALPQFPVDGVSLLDTPGYNASDVATRQQHRDNVRSQEALNSADHLIWIISARNPLLSKTDERFIRDLNLSGELVIIVNKCDEVAEVFNSTTPDTSGPIENIKRDFREAGLQYSTIIPYCARQPDWNNGKVKILDFLRRAATGKNSAQERIAEMENILNEIKKDFDNTLLHKFIKDRKEIDKYVNADPNPFELNSLAKVRGLMGYELSNLRHDRDVFNGCAKDIHTWLKKRVESGK